MARRLRSSTVSGGPILVLPILGGAAWLSDWAEKIAPPANVLFAFALAGGGLIAIILINRAAAIEERRLQGDREADERQATHARPIASLTEQFQDRTVVDAIVAGEIWHDMTQEQLLESWGRPDEVETKVMQTIVREIYKFDRTGVDRFSKRATLENGFVVGWDET